MLDELFRGLFGCHDDLEQRVDLKDALGHVARVSEPLVSAFSHRSEDCSNERHWNRRRVARCEREVQQARLEKLQVQQNLRGSSSQASMLRLRRQNSLPAPHRSGLLVGIARSSE